MTDVTNSDNFADSGDVFRGNLKIEVSRSYTSMGYDFMLLSEQSGDRLAVAKLSEVRWLNLGPSEYIERPKFKISTSALALRTLYLSLQEELVREGLLPRPLAVDEVVLLKAHLEDARAVRDKLLKILDKTGDGE